MAEPFPAADSNVCGCPPATGPAGPSRQLLLDQVFVGLTCGGCGKPWVFTGSLEDVIETLTALADLRDAGYEGPRPEPSAPAGFTLR